MFVHMLHSRTHSEPRLSAVSVTLTCSVVGSWPLKVNLST